jgi:hypothetical protein
VLSEGLETGDADIDNDGYITIDELFRYIERQLKAKRSPQRPVRWLFNAKEGELLFNARAAERRSSQEELWRLAEKYVRLRSELESGEDRTRMMADLMWLMRREVAKTVPTEADVKRWLTGSDAERIVGLAAVQVYPKAGFELRYSR